MRASEIAGLCPGKTKIKGNGIVTCCPYCQPDGPKHKGSDGHLYVEDGTDGWAHLTCLMRCPEESILNALRLTQDDRRHETKASPEISRRIESVAVKSGIPLPEPKWTKYRPEKLESRKDYLKSNGSYAFSKVRLVNPDDPKDFRCIVVDEANDRWCWTLGHLNGAADVLYNYPRVIQALVNGETIYINEGEKACDRMAKEGLVATCQRAGADPYGAKWLDLHTEMLAGAKDIVIVADRDPINLEKDHEHLVGQRYAAAVCQKLKDARLRARVVQSKTEGLKDDAYDHFEAGYGVADFVARPDLMPVSKLSALMQEAYTETFEPIEFLLGTHIRKGQTCLVSGDSGTMKSTGWLAISAGASNGWDVFGRQEIKPFRTLFFAPEDSQEDQAIMFSANGGKRGFLMHSAESFVLDESYCRDLEDEIIFGGFELVIFDPITDFMGGASPNDPEKVRPFLQRMIEVAMRSNASPVHIRHIGKGKSWWFKDSGIGSQVWRAKHREHIMQGWRPGREPGTRGEILMIPEKGSMRHEPGPPIAFCRDGDVVTWNYNPDISFMSEDEFKPRLPDFAGGKRQDAEAYLRELLSDGPKQSSELTKDIPYNTLDRASQKLGVIKRKGFNGRWTWELPAETPYNPFEDE